jgi:dTDP-4-amino-4,6-dideoxygalactose transaminase
MSDAIAFIDLAAQQDCLRDKIEPAIARALAHVGYIIGPEVKQFEADMAAFAGGGETQVVSNASGTDAPALPLMACGLKPGDAVFCPAFTSAATAEVVAWLGAVPYFVEIDEQTFNMDPGSLKQAIAECARSDLTPRAVIAVDLFGQAADYEAIRVICDENNLKLISDAVQGFGATVNGKQSIEWADFVSTSFFPAKPLSCSGDGGATLTRDEETADIMRSLRVNDKGTHKYNTVRIGMNGRLDTIQAAILVEKPAVFADEIDRRNAIADRYTEALGDILDVPRVPEGYVSTWAQYTLKMKVGAREDFAAALKDAGVPTAFYCPKPLNHQTTYENFPVAANGLPVSEELSQRILSLPMHPYLAEGV